MSTNLTAIKGDTWTRSATVLDADGEPFDFTGATVWWTLKRPNDKRNDDTNALLKFYWVDDGASSGIAISDPESGVMVVTLTPAQTDALEEGTYKYDVQVLDADGNLETPDIGTFAVSRDVTRRRTTP